MFSAETLMYALAGGIFPAILWLWFWLREDSVHPEPKTLVVSTFVAGMVVVIFVLPLQKLINDNLEGQVSTVVGIFIPLIIYFIWAGIEEVFKYFAAYVGGLRNKSMDEPIDAVIYMISAALGFVAIENTIYLASILFDTEKTTANIIVDSIVTGNLRFVGASLLHVLSSAIVGVFIALSFYKDRKTKILYLVFGLILAVALHTTYNLSIIDASGNDALMTFSVLWILILGLLFFLEKVKRLKPKR